MPSERRGKRSRPSKSRQRSPSKPAPLGVIYAGAGGGIVLGCATLVMIGWMFGRRAEPKGTPGPVAQNQPVADAPPERPRGTSGTSPVAEGSSRVEPSREEAVPVAEHPLDRSIRLELEREATAFELDTERGHLAVLGPWEKSVGIVDPAQLVEGASFDEVGLVNLSGTPTKLHYKPLKGGGLFLIGQRDPDAVVLVDSVSGEIRGTIDLEGGVPYWIAGSEDPDLPDVYIATATPQSQRALVRADLSSRALTARWDGTKLRDFAVSYDGSYVYCRVHERPTGRGPIRPQDFAGSGWDDSPDRRYREEDRRYVVGPRGRFVSSGTRVLTADFRTELPRLEFEPQAFLDGSPWAGGILDSEFVVGSINDGRIVRRLPIPLDWHRVQKPDVRKRLREQNRDGWADLLGGRVFADAKGKQFILATPKRILTFPVEELDLPVEPLLLLAEDPPRAAVVGDELNISLASMSGEPTAELVDPPAGATIAGGTLRWTPRPKHVGLRRFSVRHTEGAVSHETRWTVDVRQKTLPVPFLVRGCDPSVDGTRLIVWGHDWPDRALSPQEKVEYRPQQWRLAVVEIPELTVLAQRPFDAPIRQAEFCGADIVLSSDGDGTMRLVRFAGNDLRVLGETSIRAGAIVSIADRVLAVRSTGGTVESQMHYYDLPSLKPRDAPPVQPPREVDLRVYDVFHDARQLADGWLLDGVLWDENLREPVLLIAPEGFLHLSLVNPPVRPTITVEPVLAGFIYDRIPAGADRLPGAFADQLRDLPDVAARLRRGRGGGGEAASRDRLPYSPHLAARFDCRIDGASASLDLADLQTGEVYESIPLRIGPQERSYPYSGQDVQFTTTAEFIFITVTGETYVLPIERRAPPFRIEPRQSTLFLSATRPTRVTYEAEGASSYLLEIPALGSPGRPFQLQSEDGSFLIEPGDLTALAQAIWSTGGSGPRETIARAMQDRVHEALEMYAHLFGRRPRSGVPVRLDAYVRAARDDGETAVLHHAYIMLIPAPLFMQSQP